MTARAENPRASARLISPVLLPVLDRFVQFRFIVFGQILELLDTIDQVGVLAFQLPVDEINNVMTGNRQWSSDGLGKSGETYLVGQDYLMRSVSRFLVETPDEYLQTLIKLGVSKESIARIRRFAERRG